MPMLAHTIRSRPLVLRMSTAAELMKYNPLSFDQNTSIGKASALLEFYELDAAPIVDENARPCGVVTKAACTDWQEFGMRSSSHKAISAVHDQAAVTEIANPFVETAHERDSCRLVLLKLLEKRLPRLYVVNDENELVGVVSTGDVLRHLLAGNYSGQERSEHPDVLSGPYQRLVSWKGLNRAHLINQGY